MPISTPVITTRIRKIITYLNGVGCFVTSPGSRPGAAWSTPPISPCVTAESSCSSVLIVPSDSLIVRRSSILLVARLRHEVDDREDHDPHHVDEVPVQAGDLDRLGLLGGQPVLHRQSPQ